tara:strand:+ start:388 stop:759 length:372 start_codon:yes stop_codon:yes gene_type:complete
MGRQSYVVRFKDTVKVAEIVEVLNNHNTSDDPNIVGEEFVECGLWEVVTTAGRGPKIHVGELVIMFGNCGGRRSSFEYLQKNLPKNSIGLDYGMLFNIAEFELVKKIQLKGEYQASPTKPNVK